MRSSAEFRVLRFEPTIRDWNLLKNNWIVKESQIRFGDRKKIFSMDLVDLEQLSRSIMIRAKEILHTNTYEKLLYITELGLNKVVSRLTAEFMFINIIERTNLPEAIFLAQQAKQFFMLVENYIDYQRAEGCFARCEIIRSVSEIGYAS